MLRFIINTDLVIFDLDGTLCDTFDDIYLSLKYTLNMYDVYTPSANEVKSFIGDGLKSLIEKTLNVTNRLHLLDDVIAYFMNYYKEHCTEETKLFNGMDIVLQQLHYNQVNMAVVSNKAYHLVDIIINKLNLNSYFTYIFGGDSFNEKKPSPKPLLHIINELQISPFNAFMIGDSDNDIMAGKSANMKTIYCSYGYAQFIKSKPDFIVNNAIEILNFIR